jgi:hypothetical protein
VDWAQVTKNSVDATLYRWDPQTIGWTSRNSSGAFTGGATDGIIDPGTSFFVIASAGGASLVFPQSSKAASQAAYTHLTRAPFRLDLPSERAPVTTPLSGVRVVATGPGIPYPADVYLDLSRQDATEGFDRAYDAVAMGRSAGVDLAILGTESRSYAMQFDRPITENGSETRYYPIRVTAPVTGAATMTLRTEGRWNPLNSVSLIDGKEGRTVVMRGGELRYDFQLETLKSEGRFMLAVNHVRVDKDGVSPAFDVRLLGNPVTSDRLDVLVMHPTAKAEKWSVLTASGQQAGTGAFAGDVETVQHRITVPGMRHPGTYLLRVLMDNGDEKVVKVVRQ